MVMLIDLNPAGSVRVPISPVLTDELGRFVFPALSPSVDYRLRAGRAGYIDNSYSHTRRLSGPGDPIRLAENHWLDDLVVRLSKSGSISGTVRDESGEPVPEVYVRVCRTTIVAGESRTVLGPLTQADDAGRYRIPSLPSGQYMVLVPSVQSSYSFDASPTGPNPSVTLQDRLKNRGTPAAPVLRAGASAAIVLGHSPVPAEGAGFGFAYAPTYHPGVATAGLARPVAVTPGENVAGIDVTLRPRRAYRINGFVELSSPPMPRDSVVVLRPSEADGSLGLQSATTTVSASGRFSFLNVPTGDYVLTVTSTLNELVLARNPLAVTGRSMGSALPLGLGAGFVGTELISHPALGVSLVARGTAAGGVWGQVRIRVTDQDQENVAVPARRTGTVRGSIRFEGRPEGRSPARAPAVTLRAESAEADLERTFSTQRVTLSNSSSAFELQGLIPGAYHVRLESPGLLIKSIFWKGRDVTSSPLGVDADGVDDIIVTVTSTTASIAGSVQAGPPGGESSGNVVVFLPARPNERVAYGWKSPRIGLVPVVGGSFVIPQLPAGDYLIVAVPAVGFDLQDNRTLEMLAAVGTRIRATWGETAPATLVPLALPGLRNR
jgi:hypothetical protein